MRREISEWGGGGREMGNEGAGWAINGWGRKGSGENGSLKWG